MCFSAQASFTVAAALGITSCISLAYSNKEHRMIALVPMLFGLQQIAEGLVWLGIHNQVNHAIMIMGTYIFTFFAVFFWPLWFSYAFGAIETNHHKKTLFKNIQKSAWLYCFLAALSLLFYPPYPSIIDGHLCYFAQLALGLLLLTVIYHIILLSSFFISSFWVIRSAGILILLLSVLSITKFYSSFASIWCFFSAVASLLTLFALQQLKKNNP